MPIFTATYPASEPGRITLLSTPERTGASRQYTGKGVTIAFIDAGFYAHPDLSGRILRYADATTADVQEHALPERVEPLSWHGQMTTVIAAGDGRLSDGRYRGIAKDATLVLIKASSARNEVKEADILRGLNWLVANHARFGVRIANLSVGGDFVTDDPDHPIFVAVRQLVEAGVTVIAAAGNRGEAQIVPPASASEAITVGGLDDQNARDQAKWRLYHHNYGETLSGETKPDVLAPSVWIASPILPDTDVARQSRWLGPLLQTRDRHALNTIIKEGCDDFGIKRRQLIYARDNVYTILQERIQAHKIVDANYQYVDGTSVAAPIVSSIVAQMLEANPALTPDQIKAILKETALELPDVDAAKQGAGVVNAAGAVAAALDA